MRVKGKSIFNKLRPLLVVANVALNVLTFGLAADALFTRDDATYQVLYDNEILDTPEEDASDPWAQPHWRLRRVQCTPTACSIYQGPLFDDPETCDVYRVDGEECVEETNA